MFARKEKRHRIAERIVRMTDNDRLFFLRNAITNKKVAQLVSCGNHRLTALILIFPYAANPINTNTNIFTAMF